MYIPIERLFAAVVYAVIFFRHVHVTHPDAVWHLVDGLYTVLSRAELPSAAAYWIKDTVGIFGKLTDTDNSATFDLHNATAAYRVDILLSIEAIPIEEQDPFIQPLEHTFPDEEDGFCMDDQLSVEEFQSPVCEDDVPTQRPAPPPIETRVDDAIFPIADFQASEPLSNMTDTSFAVLRQPCRVEFLLKRYSTVFASTAVVVYAGLWLLLLFLAFVVVAVRWMSVLLDSSSVDRREVSARAVDDSVPPSSERDAGIPQFDRNPFFDVNKSRVTSRKTTSARRSNPDGFRNLVAAVGLPRQVSQPLMPKPTSIVVSIRAETSIVDDITTRSSVSEEHINEVSGAIQRLPSSPILSSLNSEEDIPTNCMTIAPIPGMDSTKDTSESVRARLDTHPAKRCGDYLLIRLVGEGGFGTVMYAMHRTSGEELAIKFTANEGDFKQSAEQEIKALRRLHHPNIIRYHSTRLSGENRAILMQYAPGGDLHDHVFSPSYVPRERTAAKWFSQLIAGVRHMHNKGIVHLDLKLANLLLDANSNVLITDFGIAQESRGARIHYVGGGTPLTSAPEAYVGPVTGPPGYDGESADVWSCGVILYTLLVGHAPWLGAPRESDYNDCEALYERIRKTGLKFPDGMERDARRLILRMLSRTPECRPTIDRVMASPWFERMGVVFGEKPDYLPVMTHDDEV